MRPALGDPSSRIETEADRVARGLAGIAPVAPQAGSRSLRRDPWLAAELGTPGGERLDAMTQRAMAQRLGRDFGDVRIHRGDPASRTARAVGARAFTVGNDVVFGAGAYAPSSPAGRDLIAHELTHVVQQREGHAAGLTDGPDWMIHRQLDGGLPPGGLPDPGTVDPPRTVTPDADPSQPSSPMFQLGQPGSRHVRRIVMARDDMLIRLETPHGAYTYHLETLTVPIGSYDTGVTVTGNDFELDFGPAVPAGQRFDFSYRVDPGQRDPAHFLAGQSSVAVEVVPHLARPRPEPPDRPRPQCLLRLDDRELVPAGSHTQPLFAPKSFKKQIWSHTIPLAEFGWVDVAAVASGSLSGTFSASYGPGMLSGICLDAVADRVVSTAPIEHPLLDPSSRAQVTTYRLTGRARFDLPARLAARIAAQGRLKVSGDYLSVIEVAAAEGSVTASADAVLSGGIHGEVEIGATVTASEANVDVGPVPIPIVGRGVLVVDPPGIVLRDTQVSGVDLRAEVGARARAALGFRVDAGAAFSLVGVELWRQSWNLARFNSAFSWSGGIRYSPNPGVHWDLGTIGPSGLDSTGDDPDAEVGDVPVHEDAAALDEDDVIAAILQEDQATVAAPDGLDPSHPLPFDWYKPMSLYPPVIRIPDAVDPHELDRDAGPTHVRFLERGREQAEQIGVADWPLDRRDFQFLRGSRRDTEKNRFNRLLDRLGYHRADWGTDGDHVWDLYLQGADWDRFDNLWPASDQDQRLAGTRHEQQIRNYEATLGNVAGRHFRIVRERHPA